MRTALVLILVGASLGCGSGATRWIGEAWRAHAEADALERSGDLERAGNLLQDLVSRPCPPASRRRTCAQSSRIPTRGSPTWR